MDSPPDRNPESPSQPADFAPPKIRTKRTKPMPHSEYRAAMNTILPVLETPLSARGVANALKECGIEMTEHQAYNLYEQIFEMHPGLQKKVIFAGSMPVRTRWSKAGSSLLDAYARAFNLSKSKTVELILQMFSVSLVHGSISLTHLLEEASKLTPDDLLIAEAILKKLDLSDYTETQRKNEREKR